MSNTIVGTPDKRQIGPVTTAASGGVAAAGVLSWIIEQIWHIEVPTDVQTYLGILFVIGAGLAVRPATRGRREA